MMKKIIPHFLLATAAFVLSACDSTSSAPPINANTSPAAANATFPKVEAETLIKNLATQNGCKDSTAEMRMSFTDQDGKPQQMDFRLQRKYEGGKVSTFVTILAPPEESEKSLLAFEEEGKPTDAISYLAGLKKIAHLKSDNPLNFRGSKSTVQEMLGMELSKYEIVAANVIAEGEKQVELKEKNGLSLAFPKIIVSFTANGSAVQRFDLYDGKGEKVKTIHAREVKPVQNLPSITQMEIEDHKRNQKLKLETRSIKYDTNIPAAVFTEANLIKVITVASGKLTQ